MAFKVVTPPTVEPVPIEVLRAHLRLDAEGTPPTHPEDDLVMAYLSAAREHAETFIGYAIAEQTWELALDSFPADGIELGGGDVKSVASVSYIDAGGVTRTLTGSDYLLDPFASPNRLLLPNGSAGWPETLTVVNAVRVRFVVGGGPLPAAIRAALLLMVGHFYENRQDVQSGVEAKQIPMGSTQLLFPYRINLGV